MKKFDFCIGNPPYNDEFGITGDNETYAPPVYNVFIDAANEVADKVELIHPARFLFDAGSTPKAWNKKMLKDKSFKILHYEAESKEIFPNTKIRGGVCISYRDASKDYGAIEVFTQYDELNTIVNKVRRSNDFGGLSKFMYLQNRFNLDALYYDYPELRKVIGSEGKDKRFETAIFEKIDLFREKPEQSDDISVYGVIKKKRLFRFFPRKYTELEHENLEKYKVVTMKSSGEGVFGELMAPFDILKPWQAFTRSFISFGAFDSEDEAVACKKYLCTKTARALLYVKKATQDNPIDTWEYVPVQDFSLSSDIDWAKSITEIDQQLYKKYGFSKEEIAFVETRVKEMA